MPLLTLILAILFLHSNLSNAATTSAKILLFGDFGTGEADQRLVADDMIDFCQKNTCDYAITTGDNIYPRGVESTKDGKADFDNGKPNYSIILNRFVAMYGKLKMPFYMSFGNHDVGNEGPVSIFKDLIKSSASIKKRTVGLMQNEINFSNHNENPAFTDALGRGSRMWYFPSEYYHTNEKGNVDIFALNTNTFPHRALNSTNDEVHKNSTNNEQKSWLITGLKARPTSWRIVFGHMPLHSRGLHNWLEESHIKDFRKDIIDVLCEQRVEFYVSGHDHHLEVGNHPCENGHVITYILTGAAAKRGRIYKSAFPIFSSEKHFRWGNGQHFEGDKSIYSNDDFALGFSYLEILDETNAKLRMKLTFRNSDKQTDGCFAIAKGKPIKKIACK